MGDIFFYKDEAHKIVLIFQIEKKDDLKCFIVCAKCKSRTFVLYEHLNLNVLFRYSLKIYLTCVVK